MQLKTTRFLASSGWTAPLPTAMDGPRTLVLAFGASQFGARAQPLAELHAAFPRAVLLGCSTAGEIAGAQVHDASISVAVARFACTDLLRAATPVQGPQDSWDAGARLARQLQVPALRAVFLLADGADVDRAALCAGLTQHLPDGVGVSGGLAADAGRSRGSWVLDGAGAASQRVVAVGWRGDQVQLGYGHARPDPSEARLAPVPADPPAHGQAPWPGDRRRDPLLAGAGQAVARATQELRRDAAPLLISVCGFGRRLVLAERSAEEARTLVDGAPCRAVHVGFYACGPIAPAPAGDSGDHGDRALTVTAISEPIAGVPVG